MQRLLKYLIWDQSTNPPRFNAAEEFQQWAVRLGFAADDAAAAWQTYAIQKSNS